MVGSWLFFNHQMLYLDGTADPVTPPLQAYLVATALFYLFVRSVALMAGVRVPRFREGEEVCPECGQPLHAASEGAPHPRLTTRADDPVPAGPRPILGAPPPVPAAPVNAPGSITHAFAAAFERARELPENPPPPDLPGPVVNPPPTGGLPSAPPLVLPRTRPPERERPGREP